MLDKKIFVELITGIQPTNTNKCDVPNCPNAGNYPAPKSASNLRQYHNFCLHHVQEYNKNWDYYRGMNYDEIEASKERDRLWNRTQTNMHRLNIDDFLYNNRPREAKEEKYDIPPQWRNINIITLKELQESLKILQITNPKTTFEQIQKIYKMFVKNHHPDQIHTTREDEEKLKEINAAFAVIKKQRALFL